MKESFPTNTEKIEIIPNEEEIRLIFEQLLENEEYSEVRKLIDEKGLYLWDVVVKTEDGGSIEYSYMRKGEYKEGSSSVTAIHTTFFDADNFPVGGESVAKFIDDDWELPQ